MTDNDQNIQNDAPNQGTADVENDNSGQNIGTNPGTASQDNQNGHRVDGIQYVAARDIYINQTPAEQQKEATRSDHQAAHHTVQWARATLMLEGDPAQFTAQEREALILVLSRILKVSEDQIRILLVTEGSIKVELELPAEAARKLEEMYQDDDPALRQLSHRLLHLETNSSEKRGTGTARVAAADPDEVVKFAQMLRLFNQELSQHSRVLQGQFSSLGETWKDQQHSEFAQEFEQLMKVLSQFLQSSEQQIPLLQRKAQRLKEFINSQEKD